MAKQDYDSEVMAVLARETALKVGCQALRWWRDKGDPRRLYIEATLALLSRQAFPVVLEALLPERQERCSHSEHQAERLASASGRCHASCGEKATLMRGFSHTGIHQVGAVRLAGLPAKEHRESGRKVRIPSLM